MMQERILVQDDEEAIREIVASMLTSANYRCRLAETPQETVDILNSAEEIDLVPGGLLEWDGEDFGRMLKAFPVTRSAN